MIIIDTNVLIWLTTNQDKLKDKIKNLLANELSSGGGIYASSFSIWEIYKLSSQERIDLKNPDIWLSRLEKTKLVRFIPVNNEIASLSVKLNSDFHQDPADRIIVATAILNKAKLVTSDKKILRYNKVKTIW